jgi:hypothetical protein
MRTRISPVIALIAIGLLAFAGCAVVTGIIGIPLATIQDEFSYLLAADMFVNGHLYYPMHPLWEFFESFHILQTPVYVSKYPPGQPFFLALGQYLSGEPIVGVWLSIAVFCAATFWMLLACTSLPFAALGIFLILTQFGLTSDWAQSYWGGAVAAAGGALVAGALFRALRQAEPMHGIVMAAGFVLLATTRPYESVGLAAVALVSFFWLVKETENKQRLFVRFVAPAAVVAAVGAGLLGYYNYAVTGNPILMPYEIYESQYSNTPIFLWQEPGVVPVYRHSMLQGCYETVLSHFEAQQSLTGYIWYKSAKLGELWRFFMGPALTIPFIASLFFLKNFYVKFAFVTVGLTMLATLLCSWTVPHYIAPAASLFYLMIVKGLEESKDWFVGRIPLGKGILVLVVLASILTFQVNLTQAMDAVGSIEWIQRRAELIAQLNSTAGEHLVVVHGEKRWGCEDWIKNEADIDNAKIVWARNMGEEKNARLLGYFAGRRVWHVHIE